MNDPNGTIQFGGTYHLFYQHNPDGPLWGDIHWGHATSTDLVHWDDEAIALAPVPGGPDSDGCFSGSAVDNNGALTLIYSGNRIYPQPDGTTRRVQSTCVATSHDGLRTWQQHPANPVIPGPPPELDTVQYRDPAVCREGDEWLCVTGSGIRDVGGTALLYRSPDLVQWDYVGPLFVGDVKSHDPLWTGPMWECPQFFALDDTRVLLISVWDSGTKYVAYYTGDYADTAFPAHTGTPRCGRLVLCPADDPGHQGRYIMWGWLRERRDRDAQSAAGWSGIMSLPRILTASLDGTLRYDPAQNWRRYAGRLRMFPSVNCVTRWYRSTASRANTPSCGQSCAGGRTHLRVAAPPLTGRGGRNAPRLRTGEWMSLAQPFALRSQGCVGHDRSGFYRDTNGDQHGGRGYVDPGGGRTAHVACLP